MSDNYKIIRKTREEIKDLKSLGWVHTKIAKTIGVAPGMISDILEIDEVALGLREPTIIKFRKFLDTRSAAKQHFADQEEKSDPKPEPAPVYVQPDLPPIYEGKKIPMPEDLLANLNELSTKFASKGYRLDCTLTLQHLPG